MKMQPKQPRARRERGILGSFPRIMLVVLAFLLLILLAWSMTGGETTYNGQGIRTPPETGTTQPAQPGAPAQDQHPQTGTGDDRPAGPTPDSEKEQP